MTPVKLAYLGARTTFNLLFLLAALLLPSNALGLPSTRVPIDVTMFVLHILPPIVCYLAVAVLAVKPGQTRVARVALFSIVAMLALRAVASVDVSLGKPELKILDAYFACTMFGIVIRTLDWALTKAPLVRYLRPANSAPSIIMDAFDLSINVRGHGWDWSNSVYVPREMRPTNRNAFAFCTFLSAAAHAFVCAVLHRAILSFAGVRSIMNGSTIIDESLPFPLRYLRASIITAFTAIGAYALMQTFYNLCTIPAVLLLGQDPAQWPPAFDAPWLSTSLHDFWGRRWHQWNRRMFLFLAGHPLSIFLGRTGIVLGAFLASAVMHDILVVRLDSNIGIWWMLVGFGMMGPGMLVERAFYQVTGKKVGGVFGWVWTMAWLLLFGSVMFEGFAKTGALGRSSPISGALPVPVWVERLVMDVDAWLHSI